MHHIICMCNNIHKVYITYHASGLIKMGRDNERKQGKEVEVMVKRALQDQREGNKERETMRGVQIERERESGACGGAYEESTL